MGGSWGERTRVTTKLGLHGTFHKNCAVRYVDSDNVRKEGRLSFFQRGKKREKKATYRKICLWPFGLVKQLGARGR